jgi:hypothetical protein
MQIKDINNTIYDKEKNKCITGKTLLLLESFLDWLVTNYAKKNNIVYTIRKNSTDINFNIYLDYKNQLKAYSKKYFDPFCRRERICINTKNLTWNVINSSNEKTNNVDELITTVGQLNFFKWFIENNVLNYAIENIEQIDKDMIETLNKNKDSSKRKELYKCASKSVCSYNLPVVVNFN